MTTLPGGSLHWLVEQSLVGVFVARDERIVFVNERFAQMLGYEAKDLVGRPLAQLVAEPDRAAVLALLRAQAARGSGGLQSNLRGLRADGQVIHLEAHATVAAIEGEAATVGLVLDVTNRIEAEEAARDAGLRLRGIFENAIEGIFQTDASGRVLTANPAMARILGYGSPEELLRQPPERNRRIYEHAGRYEEFRALLEKFDRLTNFESQVRRADGTLLWVSENARALRDATGKLVGCEGTMIDITERKRAEERLRLSEERYALAAKGASDALWDWDVVKNHLYFSARWKEMVGYGAEEVGIRPKRWLGRVHPDDRGRIAKAVVGHLKGLSPHFELEYRLQHHNGGYRWFLIRGVAVRDARGRPIRMAGSATDIHVRKLAEEKLRHDAFHDALTGLPNRALFLDRLSQALVRQYGRIKSSFSVLFIDLDRFKVVNDSLGHQLGDELLIAVARRLEDCVRPGDTVARLGGDEFAVLLEEVPDEGEAARVARRIQTELQNPVILRGQEVYSVPSIGIAHGGGEYDSAEQILRDADTAMYRAKAQGGARHEEFHPSMHAHAVKLLRLDSDLRRAMDRGELRVHYQPIYALATDTLCGFEALLRWQHPQRGLVGPLEFIPLAEETGLIHPLGEWVMHEACRQAALWSQRSRSPLSMAINLSARQFLQHDLVKQTARILRETGLSSRSLRLEVTESVLMENADRAAQVMQELRSLGATVDLDDFGTGYSSLAYLHNFRLDALKIDRSFVARADADTDAWEIVRAIVSLARGLRMELIAEGVETATQLSQLRELGVEFAQGYYFSKPLEAEEAAKLISLISPGPERAAAPSPALVPSAAAKLGQAR